MGKRASKVQSSSSPPSPNPPRAGTALHIWGCQGKPSEAIISTQQSVHAQARVGVSHLSECLEAPRSDTTERTDARTSPEHQSTTTMGLGTVTLLEINQVPTGKRIAYCLPSGEFIFVADTCAPTFGADNAADLYGGNLLQFLTLGDAEKLEDFLRAQQQRSYNSALAFNPSQQMRMVVRLLSNPSTQLWIHLSTIPLTLRMMRCIDTIRSLSSPLGHFADSSSFVLSEDEFSSVMRNPLDGTMTSGIASHSVAPSHSEDDDDLMFLEYENSCLSPTSLTSIVPLELKHRHPNFAMTHNGLRLSDAEEASYDDEDLKASLSNLAFEADWSSETLHDDQAHALFPAQPITPTSSSSGSDPTAGPGFRAELVI
ncbi:hypothetical protein PF005_g10117 [Phytophthora fragariae]|uniref:Uncharacterized protein n=1 Tax=Phytophthora fragariae TaxID=53985 RepID=A0A6A3ZG61_9STRA|nr:hypothetical protein PF009_g11351 [Phytophthora fragariae]KAE9012187.1 hypothetical protein PF011_g9034 [Phytophthora fragariae]KAE9114622.1 hypothetical protein PF010_g9639 [Phytophthora fragariae]KAE9114705.1 hypothetical protein PF007_g10285 [Phytophthora fragariae]KAE9145726.1 hypothetical protein PF006_g9455 [Phytophthora fragariae]